MSPRDAAAKIQRTYPRVYLACHVDHVRRATTPFGVTARESSLLAHLERDTPQSSKALAAHLGVAASTLSAAVKRLGALGYLESSTDPRDARQRLLSLTPLGREAMSAASVLDSGRLVKLVSRLSPSERVAAVRGLELLARAAARHMTSRGRS